MNDERAIYLLKSILPKKVSYAQMICASNCYGDERVYQEPEPYAVEYGIKAIEENIKLKAENKKLKNELEQFEIPKSEEMSNQEAIEILKKYSVKNAIIKDSEYEGFELGIKALEGIATNYDVDYELRLLDNYIHQKPIVYRVRNQNYIIVGDLLMRGTSTSGMASCINKCVELGINPYGYKLKEVINNE